MLPIEVFAFVVQEFGTNKYFDHEDKGIISKVLY